MKNLFMPALCWALAISQLFAQKTLPPSVAGYSVNWSENLKKMYHAAGYELPPAGGIPGLSQGVGERTAALQLDSTLTYYGYGLNGNDSLPILRTTYTYPVPGTKVLVESQHENGDWQLLNRFSFFADDQERLVESFSQVFDPAEQTWVNDFRLEFFPRGNSPDLVDSVLASTWNGSLGDWVRVSTVNNSFDDEERLSESLTRMVTFGLTFVFRDVYTYDGNGDNTLLESFRVVGGQDIPTNRVEMEYDNHLATTVTALVFDGLDFVPQSKLTYGYYPFGKEQTVEQDEWDATLDDWFNTQSDTFEYDDQQRLTAMERAHHFNGVEDERFRTEYDYIEGELLRLEVTISSTSTKGSSWLATRNSTSTAARYRQPHTNRCP